MLAFRNLHQVCCFHCSHLYLVVYRMFLLIFIFFSSRDSGNSRSNSWSYKQRNSEGWSVQYDCPWRGRKYERWSNWKVVGFRFISKSKLMLNCCPWESLWMLKRLLGYSVAQPYLTNGVILNLFRINFFALVNLGLIRNCSEPESQQRGSVIVLLVSSFFTCFLFWHCLAEKYL